MIRNALIVMCVAALCITGSVMLIDDDADGAIDIGSYSQDDRDNVSTSSKAYRQVSSANITATNIDSETIYVLDDASISIYTANGSHMALVGNNNLGLDMVDAVFNTRVSGNVTGTGSNTYTVTTDSTSKTFTLTAVPNTTIYVQSVELSISPSTPIVGEPFTITAHVTPSNATYPNVGWYMSNNERDNISNRVEGDTTLTGTFTSAGDYSFRAEAQGEINKWVDSEDLNVSVTSGNEYYLVFDAGSGSGGPSILESGPTSATSYRFQIPTTEPTWPPYHDFLGWSETDGATTPDYQPGDYFRTLYSTDPIGQLFAVWGEASDPTMVITGDSVVDIGDDFSLSATIAGGALSDTSVTWTIRSGMNLIDSYTQLNNTFIGTAVAAGTVTLRATSNEISSLYEDWTLTIEGPDPIVIEIHGPSTIQVGDDFDIYATVTGGTGSESSNAVTWTTIAGSEYVTLDGIQVPNHWTGTGNAPGIATFRATSTEDPSVYEDWTLTIEGPDPIVIEIHGPTSIDVGDDFDIYATVTGGTGGESSNAVTWTTIAGSEYVTLDGIQVPNHWTGTGKAAGVAVFRATSTEDSSVYEDWTLTIEAPDPIIIEIHGPTSIDVGDDFDIYATVTGGTGGESSNAVEWSTISGSEYVTLDGIQVPNHWTGTGKAAGVAVFRATSTEDPSVYEDWTLTIGSEVPLQIVISGEASIQVGETFDISATVAGGATGGSTAVTWTVRSGGQYVELDEDPAPNHISGTGAAVGSVTFRVTAQQDTSVYEEWTLNVTAQAVVMPTSITITGPGNVMMGETGKIYASVLPTNAPNRGIIWTVEVGNSLIIYETESTYRGGVLDFATKGIGTVTVRATSTADSDVYATYTLTILNPDAPENHGTLNVNNVIKALADAVFGGNTTIAGIVIYAGILLAIFLLIREPLPVVLISIPVTLILRLLRVLDNDLTVLLIIISVLGLAMLARNMWRD